MKHSVFYPIVFGYIVGIWFASIYILPIDITYLVFGIFLCITFYLLISRNAYIHYKPKTYTVFFLVCIFISCVCGGIVRYSFFISFNGDTYLSSLINRKINAEGVVIEEPIRKPTKKVEKRDLLVENIELTNSDIDLNTIDLKD